MKQTTLLIKRELQEHWRGPGMLYLTAVFVAIAGMLFINYVGLYRKNPQDGFEFTVLTPFLGNINFIFLFIAPLFSIRMLSEERRRGTLKVLMLSPLRAWQFIVAKFASVWISCLLIAFSSLLVMIPALMFFPFSPMHLLSGYLGIVLCIACYLSVGMLMAVLIESPVLSVLAGFSLLLGMMLLIAMAQAVDHYYLAILLRHLSVPLHFEAFLRGLIRSGDVVFLTGFVAVFLYASREVLKVKENW